MKKKIILGYSVLYVLHDVNNHLCWVHIIWNNAVQLENVQKEQGLNFWSLVLGVKFIYTHLGQNEILRVRFLNSDTLTFLKIDVSTWIKYYSVRISKCLLGLLALCRV